MLITFLTHLLSERVEQVMVSRNISTVEASEFVDTLGVDDPSKTYLDGLED